MTENRTPQKRRGRLAPYGRRRKRLLGPLAGGGTLQIGVDEALQVAAPHKIMILRGPRGDLIDFR